MIARRPVLLGLSAVALSAEPAAAAPAPEPRLRVGATALVARHLGEDADAAPLSVGGLAGATLRLTPRLAATARAGYLRAIADEPLALDVVPLWIGGRFALAGGPARPFVAAQLGLDVIGVGASGDLERRVELGATAGIGYAALPLAVELFAAAFDLGAADDGIAIVAAVSFEAAAL